MGAKGICEQPCGCWEFNLGPSEEQSGFLTTELPPSSHIYIRTQGQVRGKEELGTISSPFRIKKIADLGFVIFIYLKVYIMFYTVKMAGNAAKLPIYIVSCLVADFKVRIF